jgi:hypothetical protein
VLEQPSTLAVFRGVGNEVPEATNEVIYPSQEKQDPRQTHDNHHGVRAQCQEDALEKRRHLRNLDDSEQAEEPEETGAFRALADETQEAKVIRGIILLFAAKGDVGPVAEQQHDV